MKTINHLIKIVLLSLVTAVFAAPAATETSGRPPFDFVFAVTLQSDTLDWWDRVPSNTGPSIDLVTQVFRGQRILILPIIGGYAVDGQGNYDMQYGLKMRRPNGKEESIFEEIPIKGNTPNSAHMQLPQQFAVNYFEDSDEDGDYSFTVVARDNLTKKEVSHAHTVKLQPWSQLDDPALSQKEMKNGFFQYQHDRDARWLWQSFLADKMTFWQNDAPNGINYAISSFYKNAFAAQPDLFNQLVARFEKASPKQRLNIIHLNYLLGAGKIPENAMNPEERSYLAQLAPLPDPYKEIASAGDLDVLWGEFFATGNYKPIRRMVDAFDFIDAAKEEATDRATLEKGAIFKAALWSLQSNSKRIPLVRQYLGAVLEREKLSDRTGAILYTFLKKIWPERYDPSVKKDEESAEKADENQSESP